MPEARRKSLKMLSQFQAPTIMIFPSKIHLGETISAPLCCFDLIGKHVHSKSSFLSHPTNPLSIGNNIPGESHSLLCFCADTFSLPLRSPTHNLKKSISPKTVKNPNRFTPPYAPSRCCSLQMLAGRFLWTKETRMKENEAAHHNKLERRYSE